LGWGWGFRDCSPIVEFFVHFFFHEFGVIGCFHPIVLWCAKLTCQVLIDGQKTLVFCRDLIEGALFL
jgi:hypothetical protein